VMPLDRMPSIGLGIFIPAGAVYDSHHHWRNDADQWRASVRFDLGGYSDAHIQGDPVALRELAAALVQAADLAEAAASVMAEGVAR
jgi:hypothetical protein